MIAGRFAREYGCTEADWLRWLPPAVAPHGLRLLPAAGARVDIAEGHLQLHWTVLPLRRIALVQLPRMSVSFVFEGVAPQARTDFMRRFDLYMQRGGG